MSNTKYHIIRVYDYKGGELNTDLNLSFDEFINELADFYEDIDEDIDLTDVESVKKYIDDNPIEFDTYAGCGIVGEFYCTGKSGKLREISIAGFSRDIAKVIVEYAKDW